jgi:hypothetical protein
LSGEERVFGFCFVVGLPLIGTPPAQPSPRGRGSRFVGFSESEFDSVSHVGVSLPFHAVSPLSLWERVRVRGYFADTIKRWKRALPSISCV